MGAPAIFPRQAHTPTLVGNSASLPHPNGRSLRVPREVPMLDFAEPSWRPSDLTYLEATTPQLLRIGCAFGKRM